MDFTAQTKPTLKEWQSIERPVSDHEKMVLQLILDGYSNPQIRKNSTLTILQLSKMTVVDTPCIHDYFFVYYFQPEMQLSKKKNMHEYSELYDTWLKQHPVSDKLKKLNSASKIRLENLSKMLIPEKRAELFEFVLIQLAVKMLSDNTNQGFYLYTIIRLRAIEIPTLNIFIASWIDTVIIPYGTKHTDVSRVFNRARDFIEKNPNLLKYNDITLFSHQKDLFKIFPQNNHEVECECNECKRINTPKLVLYIAPTGTGKTLSPLGLSQGYRVLFVCVARHVGLALAKSAISMNKRVAFAFGCETASDIRLHNFAAVSYIVNNKSGGIYKVNNDEGQNVEIMICDIQSYLIAMHYMLAFNADPSKLILYWDEPTITLDNDTHVLHTTIHRNWSQNKIPNIVLSCATLPHEHEIQETITDFRTKFMSPTGEFGQIVTIVSHDCRKSIALLDKNGLSKLPHLLFESHKELIECVRYCRENKTLLRYFDLDEIIRFTEYMNYSTNDLPNRLKINEYFPTITSITMDSVKEYYLDVLQKVSAKSWPMIYTYMTSTQKSKFSEPGQIRKACSEEKVPIVKPGDSLQRLASVPLPKTEVNPTVNPALKGALLTTVDAHTLTDGPTIYLVEDVNKLGEFYMKSTNVASKVLETIRNNIKENEAIQAQITKLEQDLEDKLGDEIERDKKMEKEIFSKEVRGIKRGMDELRSRVKSVAMDAVYVPNMKQHQLFWIRDFVENAFVPSIDEDIIKEVMMIEGVPEYAKILLFLGIGVFSRDPNSRYIEIVKELAQQQSLFMIIAQSDYIYGTNYQFCHGFIGKDLTKMTPQKIIQAMGRIGRNTIQQEYTVRFRDERLILELFKPRSEFANLEAENMNKLFVTE